MHITFIFVFFEVLQVTYTCSEMNSLWNFSWVKENEVAASSAPENSEHLQWLQSQGIKHVLCLDEVSVYLDDMLKIDFLVVLIKLSVLPFCSHLQIKNKL